MLGRESSRSLGYLSELFIMERKTRALPGLQARPREICPEIQSNSKYFVLENEVLRSLG